MSMDTVNYRLPVPGNVPAEQIENNSSTRADVTSATTLELISITEWDKTLALFDDIVPEQSGAFNASHWGEENIECVKIMRHAELIGGASVLVRNIPFTSTGIAILKWGPLWQPAGRTSDNTDYKDVVTALVDEYCRKRNLHLTIMPAVFPDTVEQTCEGLRALGFKTGNALAAPEKYIVNTNQSPEELMASLNQKWRYNLRKANKNEFKIWFATGEEGVEEFLSLYEKMMARKKYLDASAIGSLRNIMQNSAEQIRPRIVLVSHQDEITAGGVFSICGTMANYMFGATDNRALALKAGYAMHWWVAEFLCNQPDMLMYDLGGNDLDAGLHQFKKGFVGKTGHILDAPPRYHFAASTLANLVGNSIFQMRDARASALRMFHSFKNKTTK